MRASSVRACAMTKPRISSTRTTWPLVASRTAAAETCSLKTEDTWARRMTQTWRPSGLTATALRPAASLTWYSSLPRSSPQWGAAPPGRQTSRAHVSEPSAGSNDMRAASGLSGLFPRDSS